MWAEFKAFLIKQNALALAIAFVIGAALNTVVQAIVNDIIMPIVAVAAPAGEWQKTMWELGPFHFGVGNLASAVINFLIIGFVAWRLSKMFIKGRSARRGAGHQGVPVLQDVHRCAGHALPALHERVVGRLPQP